MKQLVPVFIFITWMLIPGLRSLQAQHPNVVIGHVAGSELPTEPAVVMNPSNTGEILVAGMPDNDYLSTDGGLTWTHGQLSSPFGVNADPVLLVDQSGRYYYLHLPYAIDRVVCHRRDGAGSGWNMESTAAYDGMHDVDKEWASYDPVNDMIYLSWTYFDEWGSSSPQDSSCIWLSKSADGGVTWSSPVRVSDRKGNATGGTYSTHGSYNTTGPGGEVYVAWFGPDGLMFDRSTDQGVTWLPNDIPVTGQHIGWQYAIPGVSLGVTFPFISCDRSGGPHNGTIYITWADKRNGAANTDVFIVRSADGGLTWTEPARVNDDPPGHHQFFPAMTVDQVTGKVWVVFFDRREHPDVSTDVYAAVSNDGGATFTNFKISESPFIPYSTVFFGHYIGIAAHNDHVFPVWNRMDDGVSTLMGAVVNPAVVGTGRDRALPGAVVQAYPNPFRESSFVSFRLTGNGYVSMQLYDARGVLAATLADRQYFSAGKHVVSVDAVGLGLAPGVYILKLYPGTSQVTTRMMVVGR